MAKDGIGRKEFHYVIPLGPDGEPLYGEKSHAWAQMTEPGTTEAFACTRCVSHTVQATAADVDTNVVLRAEGSLDGENWFAFADEDTTVLEDGTVAFTYEGPLAYVRLNFVSETADPSTATVDARYLGRTYW